MTQTLFGGLSPQPEDKIIGLMQAFREDPREAKVDLGVGVYKNAAGHTPVMRAIRRAEERLLANETTKTYTALAGEADFRAAMAGLVLGEDHDASRLASLATVGGTGAIRIALELVRMVNRDAKVWLSDPTWPNHAPIVTQAGLTVATYRYFDADARAVDFDGMIASLDGVTAGDVVLLHGCCHNPTGANLTLPEWRQVAELLRGKGALPLVDLAYQGFGDGLADDAAAVRMLADMFPEMMIGASCSKNFGLYRERAGALLVLNGDASQAKVTQGNLTALNRLAYSFPPDHGARLVTMVLNDPDLRADWQAELEEMRTGMIRMRETLASELQRLTGSDAFGFLAAHRGMFSRLGATPEQLDRLRIDKGVYIVGDSRMNIAGLNDNNVRIVAKAIADTL